MSNDQAFERFHFFNLFCGNPVFSASLQRMVLGRRAYLKSLKDEELIRVYKEKQWAACIDELYKRYGYLVYGVQLKYTKQTMDAEDLTMECFAKLPSLILKHDIAFFKGWLYTVARNLALAFLRKNKTNLTTQIDEQLTSIPDEESDINIEGQLNLLEWAIPQLKPQQKTCIVLFYIDQLSYEQIMTETGYSFNEVKSHVQNGKRKLKLLMEQNQSYEGK
jgi:RNA polymerase sigma-70 factor (ECF subfamily)